MAYIHLVTGSSPVGNTIKNHIMKNKLYTSLPNNNFYLTGISEHQGILQEHGFCKTLLVRRLTIDWKHLFTEIFVRKTIEIDSLLKVLSVDLFTYISYMTNHLRRIYHLNRQYINNVENIVKEDDNRFFPILQIFGNPVILLDFDGVVTSNQFRIFYERLVNEYTVYIVTANPDVKKEWFIKQGLSVPNQIYANKGKEKKIRCLFQMIQKYPILVYIDNEKEYLNYAFKMCIKTYHWEHNKIKHYSLL